MKKSRWSSFYFSIGFIKLLLCLIKKIIIAHTLIIIILKLKLFFDSNFRSKNICMHIWFWSSLVCMSRFYFFLTILWVICALRKISLFLSLQRETIWLLFEKKKKISNFYYLKLCLGQKMWREQLKSRIMLLVDQSK